MKLCQLKRCEDASTIRRAETDDGILLGYIGQVGDFMAKQWVKKTAGETVDDIERATWLYIAIDRRVYQNGIREGVLAMARRDEVIQKAQIKSEELRKAVQDKMDDIRKELVKKYGAGNQGTITKVGRLLLADKEGIKL